MIFSFTESVIYYLTIHVQIAKSMLLLKSYYRLKWQAEVSVAVTSGYQNFSPHIATICRNTVSSYFCRQITIFYNPFINKKGW